MALLHRSAAPALVAAIVVLVAGALLIATNAAAGDRIRATGNGKVDAAALYHNYCSVCHGDHGDGNSRAKGSLNPPPANFLDPKLQGKLTREYIGAIIRGGKPKTAMVSYTTQLNDGEIDALAAYVRATFVDHAGDEQLVRGRTLYGHFCVSCHGVTGAGVANAVPAGQPQPRDFTNEAVRKELTRDRLVAAVAIGRKGTAMNGFAGQLQPQDIEAVVDYVQKTLMTSQGGNISGTSAYGGQERRK